MLVTLGLCYLNVLICFSHWCFTPEKSIFTTDNKDDENETNEMSKIKTM